MMKKLMKNKWLWIISVVCVIAAGAYYMQMGSTGELVKVYEVDKGPVVDYIEDTGEVIAEQSATIYSDLTAKVETINVDIGDEVKKGDILFTLDDDALQYQLEVLKATKAGLTASKSELEKPTDSNLLQKLSAVVNSAKLAYEQLSDQLKTQEALLESGAVSQSVVDDLSSAVDIAYANYQAAVNDYQMAKKGTSGNVVDQAKSSLAAVDVQISELESMIAKASVTAPYEGVVVTKHVSIGDYVATGMPLVTIDQLGQMYIKADLLADDIMMLEVGARVVISNDSGIETQGKIRKIYPKAHTKVSDLGVEQKRVTVEIEFDSQVGMKLGYEYDLEVVLKEVEGIRIPDSAYFKINGNGHVFLVKDMEVVLTQIETLTEGVDYYEVSGLQVGDMVVQSPATELEDGMTVQLEEESIMDER
ncbi:biotin/lipoyl-binding protein [Fusibacter sp. A1]|nr:biotin/lipoyl-binding protein [Fusibacter sp. A1]